MKSGKVLPLHSCDKVWLSHAPCSWRCPTAHLADVIADCTHQGLMMLRIGQDSGRHIRTPRWLTACSPLGYFTICGPRPRTPTETLFISSVHPFWKMKPLCDPSSTRPFKGRVEGGLSWRSNLQKGRHTGQGVDAETSTILHRHGHPLTPAPAHGPSSKKLWPA